MYNTNVNNTDTVKDSPPLIFVFPNGKFVPPGKRENMRWTVFCYPVSKKIDHKQSSPLTHTDEEVGSISGRAYPYILYQTICGFSPEEVISIMRWFLVLTGQSNRSEPGEGEIKTFLLGNSSSPLFSPPLTLPARGDTLRVILDALREKLGYLGYSGIDVNKEWTEFFEEVFYLINLENYITVYKSSDTAQGPKKIKFIIEEMDKGRYFDIHGNIAPIVDWLVFNLAWDTGLKRKLAAENTRYISLYQAAIQQLVYIILYALLSETQDSVNVFESSAGPVMAVIFSGNPDITGKELMLIDFDWESPQLKISSKVFKIGDYYHSGTGQDGWMNNYWILGIKSRLSGVDNETADYLKTKYPYLIMNLIRTDSGFLSLLCLSRAGAYETVLNDHLSAIAECNAARDCVAVEFPLLKKLMQMCIKNPHLPFAGQISGELEKYLSAIQEFFKKNLREIDADIFSQAVNTDIYTQSLVFYWEKFIALLEELNDPDISRKLEAAANRGDIFTAVNNNLLSTLKDIWPLLTAICCFDNNLSPEHLNIKEGALLRALIQRTYSQSALSPGVSSSLLAGGSKGVRNRDIIKSRGVNGNINVQSAQFFYGEPFAYIEHLYSEKFPVSAHVAKNPVLDLDSFLYGRVGLELDIERIRNFVVRNFHYLILLYPVTGNDYDFVDRLFIDYFQSSFRKGFSNKNSFFKTIFDNIRCVYCRDYFFFGYLALKHSNLCMVSKYNRVKHNNFFIRMIPVKTPVSTTIIFFTLSYGYYFVNSKLELLCYFLIASSSLLADGMDSGSRFLVSSGLCRAGPKFIRCFAWIIAVLSGIMLFLCCYFVYFPPSPYPRFKNTDPSIFYIVRDGALLKGARIGHSSKAIVEKGDNCITLINQAEAGRDQTAVLYISFKDGPIDYSPYKELVIEAELSNGAEYLAAALCIIKDNSTGNKQRAILSTTFVITDLLYPIPFERFGLLFSDNYFNCIAIAFGGPIEINNGEERIERELNPPNAVIKIKTIKLIRPMTQVKSKELIKSASISSAVIYLPFANINPDKEEWLGKCEAKSGKIHLMKNANSAYWLFLYHTATATALKLTFLQLNNLISYIPDGFPTLIINGWGDAGVILKDADFALQYDESGAGRLGVIMPQAIIDYIAKQQHQHHARRHNSRNSEKNNSAKYYPTNGKLSDGFSWNLCASSSAVEFEKTDSIGVSRDYLQGSEGVKTILDLLNSNGGWILLIDLRWMGLRNRMLGSRDQGDEIIFNMWTGMIRIFERYKGGVAKTKPGAGDEFIAYLPMIQEEIVRDIFCQIQNCAVEIELSREKSNSGKYEYAPPYIACGGAKVAKKLRKNSSKWIDTMLALAANNLKQAKGNSDPFQMCVLSSYASNGANHNSGSKKLFSEKEKRLLDTRIELMVTETTRQSLTSDTSFGVLSIGELIWGLDNCQSGIWFARENPDTIYLAIKRENTARIVRFNLQYTTDNQEFVQKIVRTRQDDDGSASGKIYAGFQLVNSLFPVESEADYMIKLLIVELNAAVKNKIEVLKSGGDSHVFNQCLQGIVDSAQEEINAALKLYEIEVLLRSITITQEISQDQEKIKETIEFLRRVSKIRRLDGLLEITEAKYSDLQEKAKQVAQEIEEAARERLRKIAEDCLRYGALVKTGATTEEVPEQNEKAILVSSGVVRVGLAANALVLLASKPKIETNNNNRAEGIIEQVTSSCVFANAPPALASLRVSSGVLAIYGGVFAAWIGEIRRDKRIKAVRKQGCRLLSIIFSVVCLLSLPYVVKAEKTVFDAFSFIEQQEKQEIINLADEKTDNIRELEPAEIFAILERSGNSQSQISITDLVYKFPDVFSALSWEDSHRLYRLIAERPGYMTTPGRLLVEISGSFVNDALDCVKYLEQHNYTPVLVDFFSELMDENRRIGEKPETNELFARLAEEKEMEWVEHYENLAVIKKIDEWKSEIDRFENWLYPLGDEEQTANLADSAQKFIDMGNVYSELAFWLPKKQDFSVRDLMDLEEYTQNRKIYYGAALGLLESIENSWGISSLIAYYAEIEAGDIVGEIYQYAQGQGIYVYDKEHNDLPIFLGAELYRVYKTTGSSTALEYAHYFYGETAAAGYPVNHVSMEQFYRAVLEDNRYFTSVLAVEKSVNFLSLMQLAAQSAAKPVHPRIMPLPVPGKRAAPDSFVKSRQQGKPKQGKAIPEKTAPCAKKKENFISVAGLLLFVAAAAAVARTAIVKIYKRLSSSSVKNNSGSVFRSPRVSSSLMAGGWLGAAVCRAGVFSSSIVCSVFSSVRDCIKRLQCFRKLVTVVLLASLILIPGASKIKNGFDFSGLNFVNKTDYLYLSKENFVNAIEDLITRTLYEDNPDTLGCLISSAYERNLYAIYGLCRLAERDVFFAKITEMIIRNIGPSAIIEKIKQKGEFCEIEDTDILRTMYILFGEKSAFDALVYLIEQYGLEEAVSEFNVITYYRMDLRVNAVCGNLNSVRLIERAKKGNAYALMYVVSLAFLGNKAAQIALRDFDFTKLMKQPENKHYSMVSALCDLLRWGNTNAIFELKSRAEQGNARACQILSYSYLQSDVVKVAVSELDITKIREKIEEGDASLIAPMVFFGENNNVAAKEVTPVLNIASFKNGITGLSQKNYMITEAMLKLAEAGHLAALDVVNELARNNNENISCYANIKMTELRAARSVEHISNQETKRRLTQYSLNNQPLLLSLFFIERENVTVLADMMLEELQHQAQKAGINLNAFLVSLHRKRLYKNFIFQTAHFNRLNRLITARQDVRHIMDIMCRNKNAEEIKLSAQRVAIFVENVLMDETFQYQEEFQKYLRRLYDKTSGLNRKLLAALLGIYKNKFNYLSCEDIAKISQKHRIEINDMNINYDNLFKGSDLIVHIVFADGDLHDQIRPTCRFFIWESHLENALKPPIVKEGMGEFLASFWSVMDDVSDTRRFILKKENIQLVLIKAEEDEYDINAALKEGVGIIISQTHWNRERRVFKRQRLNGDESNGRIGFVSSCRSATVLGELQRDYNGMMFFTTKGLETGSKTNMLTYWLLEALKNKKVLTYGQLRSFLKMHMPARDFNNYLLPYDPAYQVLEFILKEGGSLSSPLAGGRRETGLFVSSTVFENLEDCLRYGALVKTGATTEEVPEQNEKAILVSSGIVRVGLAANALVLLASKPRIETNNNNRAEGIIEQVTSSCVFANAPPALASLRVSSSPLLSVNPEWLKDAEGLNAMQRCNRIVPGVFAGVTEMEKICLRKSDRGRNGLEEYPQLILPGVIAAVFTLLGNNSNNRYIPILNTKKAAYWFRRILEIVLSSLGMQAAVVVGEEERLKAPTGLGIGEVVGKGKRQLELLIDVVEGVVSLSQKSLQGLGNFIIYAVPGTLERLSDYWYQKIIAVGQAAKKAELDVNRISWSLDNVIKESGQTKEKVVVFCLFRQRNKGLINELAKWLGWSVIDEKDFQKIEQQIKQTGITRVGNIMLGSAQDLPAALGLLQQGEITALVDSPRSPETIGIAAIVKTMQGAMKAQLRPYEAMQKPDADLDGDKNNLSPFELDLLWQIACSWPEKMNLEDRRRKLVEYWEKQRGVDDFVRNNEFVAVYTAMKTSPFLSQVEGIEFVPETGESKVFSVWLSGSGEINIIKTHLSTRIPELSQRLRQTSDKKEQAKLHYWIAEIFTRLRDFVSANKELEQAGKLDSANKKYAAAPHYLDALKHILFTDDNPNERALNCLKQALKKDPADRVHAWLLAKEIRIVLGRKFLERMIKAGKAENVKVILKNAKHARVQFARALKLYPSKVSHYLRLERNLIECYLKLISLMTEPSKYYEALGQEYYYGLSWCFSDISGLLQEIGLNRGMINEFKNMIEACNSVVVREKGGGLLLIQSQFGLAKIYEQRKYFLCALRKYSKLYVPEETRKITQGAAQTESDEDLDAIAEVLFMGYRIEALRRSLILLMTLSCESAQCIAEFEGMFKDKNVRISYDEKTNTIQLVKDNETKMTFLADVERFNLFSDATQSSPIKKERGSHNNSSPMEDNNHHIDKAAVMAIIRKLPTVDNIISDAYSSPLAETDGISGYDTEQVSLADIIKAVLEERFAGHKITEVMRDVVSQLLTDPKITARELIKSVKSLSEDYAYRILTMLRMDNFKRGAISILAENLLEKETNAGDLVEKIRENHKHLVLPVTIAVLANESGFFSNKSIKQLLDEVLEYIDQTVLTNDETVAIAIFKQVSEARNQLEVVKEGGCGDPKAVMDKFESACRLIAGKIKEKSDSMSRLSAYQQEYELEIFEELLKRLVMGRELIDYEKERIIAIVESMDWDRYNASPQKEIIKKWLEFDKKDSRRKVARELGIGHTALAVNLAGLTPNLTRDALRLSVRIGSLKAVFGNPLFNLALSFGICPEEINNDFPVRKKIESFFTAVKKHLIVEALSRLIEHSPEVKCAGREIEKEAPLVILYLKYPDKTNEELHHLIEQLGLKMKKGRIKLRINEIMKNILFSVIKERKENARPELNKEFLQQAEKLLRCETTNEFILVLNDAIRQCSPNGQPRKENKGGDDSEGIAAGKALIEKQKNVIESVLKYASLLVDWNMPDLERHICEKNDLEMLIKVIFAKLEMLITGKNKRSAVEARKRREQESKIKELEEIIAQLNETISRQNVKIDELFIRGPAAKASDSRLSQYQEENTQLRNKIGRLQQFQEGPKQSADAQDLGKTVRPESERSAFWELVQLALELIKKIRLSEETGGLSPDEIRNSAAVEATVRAVEEFCPGRGATFSTFLGTMLTHIIQEIIRSYLGRGSKRLPKGNRVDIDEIDITTAEKGAIQATIEEREISEQLILALEELPLEQKQIIEASLVDKRSEEIKKVKGNISKSVFYERQKKALKALREKLQERGIFSSSSVEEEGGSHNEDSSGWRGGKRGYSIQPSISSRSVVLKFICPAAILISAYIFIVNGDVMGGVLLLLLAAIYGGVFAAWIGKIRRDKRIKAVRKQDNDASDKGNTSSEHNNSSPVEDNNQHIDKAAVTAIIRKLPTLSGNRLFNELQTTGYNGSKAQCFRELDTLGGLKKLKEEFWREESEQLPKILEENPFLKMKDYRKRFNKITLEWLDRMIKKYTNERWGVLRAVALRERIKKQWRKDAKIKKNRIFDLTNLYNEFSKSMIWTGDKHNFHSKVNEQLSVINTSPTKIKEEILQEIRQDVRKKLKENPLIEVEEFRNVLGYNRINIRSFQYWFKPAGGFWKSRAEALKERIAEEKQKNPRLDLFELQKILKDKSNFKRFKKRIKGILKHADTTFTKITPSVDNSLPSASSSPLQSPQPPVILFGSVSSPVEDIRDSPSPRVSSGFVENEESGDIIKQLEAMLAQGEAELGVWQVSLSSLDSDRGLPEEIEKGDKLTNGAIKDYLCTLGHSSIARIWDVDGKDSEIENKLKLLTQPIEVIICLNLEKSDDPFQLICRLHNRLVKQGIFVGCIALSGSNPAQTAKIYEEFAVNMRAFGATVTVQKGAFEGKKQLVLFAKNNRGLILGVDHETGVDNVPIVVRGLTEREKESFAKYIHKYIQERSQAITKLVDLIVNLIKFLVELSASEITNEQIKNKYTEICQKAEELTIKQDSFSQHDLLLHNVMYVTPADRINNKLSFVELILVLSTEHKLCDDKVKQTALRLVSGLEDFLWAVFMLQSAVRILDPCFVKKDGIMADLRQIKPVENWLSLCDESFKPWVKNVEKMKRYLGSDKMVSSAMVYDDCDEDEEGEINTEAILKVKTEILNLFGADALDLKGIDLNRPIDLSRINEICKKNYLFRYFKGGIKQAIEIVGLQKELCDILNQLWCIYGCYKLVAKWLHITPHLLYLMRKDWDLDLSKEDICLDKPADYLLPVAGYSKEQILNWAKDIYKWNLRKLRKYLKLDSVAYWNLIIGLGLKEEFTKVLRERYDMANEHFYREMAGQFGLRGSAAASDLQRIIRCLGIKLESKNKIRRAKKPPVESPRRKKASSAVEKTDRQSSLASSVSLSNGRRKQLPEWTKE